MQELRFVAVSEDGSYAVLAVPGRSGRYILPIDERLRAVAQGQTSRLAQYEIEVESPLRPKEIQARIRAGETAEEIADAAGIPVERVRWFEGPVLAERAYIAQQAQAGSVRRAGDSSGPGPRLDDIVTERLSAAGTDPADGQWDSRKRGDGNWQVSLTFPSGGRLHVAEWVFDPRRRHVMPDDDNAARLSLPESELPPEPVAVPGEATVTPIASRLSAAAGMGGGTGGFGSVGPAVSRFRPERSVIPDRSLGADRSLADRPLADRPMPQAPAPERPAAAATATAERAAVGHTPAASPAMPRPQSQPPERGGYQPRGASPGYAEFPESAPYRAPETASEPSGYRPAQQPPSGYTEPSGYPAAPGYRDAPPAPSAYRPPADDQPGYRAPVASPAPGSRVTERPATAAPAAPGDARDLEERTPVTPSRPVVFEDPEPTFLSEQLELTADVPHQRDDVTAGATRDAAPADPPRPAEASSRAAVADPAPPAPAEPETPAAESTRAAPAATESRAARPVVDAAEATAAPPEAEPAPRSEAKPVPQAPAAAQAAPAPSTAPARAAESAEAPVPSPATVAAALAAKAPAASPAPAPPVKATVAEPRVPERVPEDQAPDVKTSAAPAEAAGPPAEPSAAEPSAPAAKPAGETEPAKAAEAKPAEAEPKPAEAEASEVAEAEASEGAEAKASEGAEAEAEPAAAVDGAASTSRAAEVRATEADGAEPAAEEAAKATSDPKPEVPAPAEPPTSEGQSGRGRPGAKKNAKGRRSSVPSWDEIMLGSSRPRD